MVKPRKFSYKLQRSLINFFIGCRRIKVKKGFNVSTHALYYTKFFSFDTYGIILQILCQKKETSKTKHRNCSRSKQQKQLDFLYVKAQGLAVHGRIQFFVNS